MIGRPLLFLIGWWCFISCHHISTGDNSYDTPLYLPPVSHPIDTVHRYTINQFTGDSIKPIGNYFQDTVKTGTPVLLEGKMVSMDSLPSPESVIIKGTTGAWYSNLYLLTTSTPSFSIDENKLDKYLPNADSCNCPLINTYGDTLPMGIPVKIPLVYQAFQVPKSSPALPPRMRDNARFDIQYLDLDQGMKSLSPLAIMEDKRGNIWMAVNDVSQYDGASFRHFSKGEGTQLTHKQSMMVDSKGRNWFCGAGGIICTNGSTYFNLSAEKRELYRNDIKALVEDHDGNIWLGARQGVVSRIQFIGNDTAVLTHYTLSNQTNEAHILTALVDRKGNVWFGTDRDGLFRYNGRNFTHFNDQAGIPNPMVAGLCEDNEGNIWIGTNAGLCRYTPNLEPAKSSLQSYSVKDGLSSDHIKTVLTAQDGTLWLATWTGGVNHIIPPGKNGDNWYCEHYTTEEGLSTNTVRTIMEDRTGNIWICPDGAGVHILKPNSFQHISDLKELTELNIVRIMRDSKGNIWFGTEGPGLHMLEPATISRPATLHHYQLHNDPRLGWTKAILEDNDGNIWFGGKEGFWKLKPQANYSAIELIHYSFWEPLRLPWVVRMVQDPQGNFWMATYGGGVVRWKPEDDTHGTFVHYSEYFGFSCDYLTSIAADQDGNIWIGTDQNGITELQPSANGERATMINYTEREGLASNFIIDMQQDAASNFWIATNWNGAYYFEVPRNAKQGRCTSYATTQGLSANEARSVFLPSLPMLSNQVWISTTNGINLIRSDSMKSVVSFRKAEGLKIPSFEAGCVEEDEKGFLWWGSEKGLEILNIKQLQLSKQIPQPVLHQVDVNEQSIRYSDIPKDLQRKIKFKQTIAFENLPVDPQFSYKVNHLTFHFSAIDWASPQKIKYSYKIDGLNKDWSIPSEETKADYRNLPSGTHTFSLRAIGESQTWSPPYTYTFVINPPWWYSWWAMVMYSVLGGFVLYGSHRYQLNRKLELEEKKRLIELDRIKNRLYTNITHEFRTPLTLIHGPVSQALSRNTGLEQKEIQSIHRQSERMQVLINQMLELQKLEAGMLHPHYAYGEIILMLKNLFQSFETWSGKKNISLIYSSTLHEVYMDFDAEKINQIISNLVSNAIKHTPRNGKVAMIVSASDSGDELIIEIKDTGVGISEEDLPHIFDRFYQTNRASTGGTGIGLALVKNLVELLGGKITVESKLDIGSSFLLRLPIIRHAIEIKSHTPEPERFSAEEHGDEMQFLPDEKTRREKPYILVIEDNHEVSAYILSCLQKDYTVITAFNGDDGIRQALESIPDLIISDVMMPGKDGFEVCREVKKDIRTSHIPFILLTGRGDQKGLMAGIEYGADAYIIKPFNPDELLLRIQKLLELRTSLSLYYRQHAGAEKPIVNEQASVQENAFLVKLRNVIEEHMDDPQFSILKLSHIMAMSHPQLHRKITSLTGESTGKFVRSVRLSKAVEWLKNSDLTIAEIAYKAGFNEPGYFTKVFSKEFGESPSEFRNKPG